MIVVLADDKYASSVHTSTRMLLMYCSALSLARRRWPNECVDTQQLIRGIRSFSFSARWRKRDLHFDILLEWGKTSDIVSSENDWVHESMNICGGTISISHRLAPKILIEPSEKIAKNSSRDKASKSEELLPPTRSERKNQSEEKIITKQLRWSADERAITCVFIANRIDGTSSNHFEVTNEHERRKQRGILASRLRKKPRLFPPNERNCWKINLILTNESQMGMRVTLPDQSQSASLRYSFIEDENRAAIS